MTCKTQAESQDIAEEQVSFDRPSRNQSTAICTDRIAKHNSTASTKKKKVTWNLINYTARANRAGFDGKATTPKRS